MNIHRLFRKLQQQFPAWDFSVTCLVKKVGDSTPEYSGIQIKAQLPEVNVNICRSIPENVIESMTPDEAADVAVVALRPELDVANRTLQDHLKAEARA